MTDMHREGFSRLDSFHVGQIWESPRGFLYRVVAVTRGGNASLRLGNDGNGRIIRRDWDAVIGWVIYSDAEAALRYRDEQDQTSVWRCYKEYMSGDGGRVYSEKFAKTKADMLIFKSQGYDCEKLIDEQEKQA